MSAPAIEIPDSVHHGAELWSKGIQKQLILKDRVRFDPGEELLYHYQSEGASLATLFSGDVTANCLLLTNKRLIRVTPKGEAASSSSASSSVDTKHRGKGKSGGAAAAAAAASGGGCTVVDVARADIVKVAHTRGGAFADDALTVTLWDRNAVTVTVYHERVAAFFARVLDDGIRAKQQAPPDFTKYEIPKSVRYSRALEQYKILQNLKANKLLVLGDGETLQFHYCNTRTNLIVADETEDCVLLTNRRVVSVLKKKVTLNVPFSWIAKARHQKAKTIGYDKVLCTLMGGDERDIPVLSSEVCAFFTLVIHERLQYRNTLLHDNASLANNKPAGARLLGSGATNGGDGSGSPTAAGGGGAGGGGAGGAHGGGLKLLQRDRDFSDDQTYFVVWPSSPHLVLDVQPNPDGSDEPLLVLAERTGAISQKWYRHENGGHLVSCLLSSAYRKRRHKTHVHVKPPDWLFALKWHPVHAAGAAAGPNAANHAPGAAPTDIVEIKHVIRLSPEVQRSVYLTIDGVCCGHPDCEEPRVRAGSICRMAVPQGSGQGRGAGVVTPGHKHSASYSGALAPAAGSSGAAGSPANGSAAVVARPGGAAVGGAAGGGGAAAAAVERVCSPLQRWSLKTEFDVFMDDLVAPVIDSLKTYRKQVQDRLKARRDGDDAAAGGGAKPAAAIAFLPADQIRYECVVNANCEFSIWRPIPAPGYVMFGDVAQFGYDYPGGGGSGGSGSGSQTASNSALLNRYAVCAKEHPAFVQPASYALDWHQAIGGITSVGGTSTTTTTASIRVYFWRPEPGPQHAQCVALGYVATTDPTPPPVGLVRLVHKKYLIENKGASALTQIWADTTLKVPLYMSLLLNPRNILTHTVNHFLQDDGASKKVKLSGALLPPSQQHKQSGAGLMAAAGGSGGGDQYDDDVKQDSKASKASAAAAAAALAKRQKEQEEAEAKEASMDLLNTAISSVSGVYSFVDGVRVALTAPQHNDVALSIWNSRDLNTFALNTSHARPQGARYRFPLRDDERRATLLRLYRDGVLMLAECIRQLSSMITKVQRMERLKQRQKEEEAARAKAAAAAARAPEKSARPSGVTRSPPPTAAMVVPFDDPESPRRPGVGGAAGALLSDDDDDWVDEKKPAKAAGAKGGAAAGSGDVDPNGANTNANAVELSYAQTRELLEAIDECLKYEELMRLYDDDIKQLNVERDVRDSQQRVNQVKLELAELKRYIKRYVKLDICAELEQPRTNTAAAGATGSLSGPVSYDDKALAWAIARMSEAWDVLELLPAVDWPEAVSWDFTLEELRIPKVKETVKMMVANPPRDFNTRMTQWVLDSFRKFIVKRFDSIVKPVFARKPTAAAAAAGDVKGGGAKDAKKPAAAAAAAEEDAQRIPVQTVLDALRTLVDDLNTINRLAGIEEIVQFAARHYHKQVMAVMTTKLLRHPHVRMTPGDVGKCVKWVHAYETFVKPHTDADLFDEIERDTARLTESLTDIYLGLTKSKIVAVVSQVLKAEENDAAPPNRDPSSGRYFSAAPQDFFGFLDNSLSQADSAHGMTGSAIARVAIAYTHIIKFFAESRKRYLSQALNSPTRAQEDEIKKLSAQAAAATTTAAASASSAAGGAAGGSGGVDADVPYYVACGSVVKPHIYFLGQINNVPLFVHHLDNLKAHCLRLIMAGVTPAAQAGVALGGAPAAGAAGVPDDALKAAIEELENLFDECKQQYLDLAALCTEVLGRAMVRNHAALLAAFFGPGWYKGQVQVVASIVERLSRAYERFRLDTSGNDAIMGKLVKSTLNELVNEYALRFAQKQIASPLAAQLEKIVAQASTSAAVALANRAKFVELVRGDRTTLWKYYAECPYFKSPKVLETEINAIAILENVLTAADDELEARVTELDKRFGDANSSVRPGVFLRALLEFRGGVTKERKAELLARFGADATATNPYKPRGTDAAAAETLTAAAKTMRQTVLEITVEGGTGLQGFPTSTLLAAGAAKLTADPYVVVKVMGGDAPPQVGAKPGAGGDTKDLSATDELKQGLRNLFTFGDDKPSAGAAGGAGGSAAGGGLLKRGGNAKVLLERKTSRLERTLEPRWREIVNDIPSEIAAQFRYVQFEVWHASATSNALGGLGVADPDFMGQAVVTVETIREQLVIQRTTTLAPGVAATASPGKAAAEHNRIRLELKLAPRPDKPRERVKGSLVVHIRYQQMDVDASAANAKRVADAQKPSEDLASLLTRTLTFGLAGSDSKSKPKPSGSSGSGGSGGANTTETGGGANTTAEGGKSGGGKRGGGGAGGNTKDKRLASLGEGEDQECSIM